MNLAHLRQLRIRATLEGSESLPLLETLEELCELADVDDTDELVEGWPYENEPTSSNVIPIERESANTLYERAGELDEDPSTFETAETLYKRAVKLDPSMAIAWTNLGNVLHRQGKTQEAVAAYQRALQIRPAQVEALYNMGVVVENAEQSIQWFERALTSDPNHADAHFHLASALDEVGRPEPARRHWKRFLELEPKSKYAGIARAAIGLRRVK